MHALRKFGDVGDYLRLTSRLLHLFVESIHFILKCCKEEIAGRILLQENVTVLNQKISRFFERRYGHEFFANTVILLRKIVAVGMNVFIISAMAKNVQMKEIFKAILPFLASDIIRITLLVFFPGIALIALRVFN